jgi:hypothetical protein
MDYQGKKFVHFPLQYMYIGTWEEMILPKHLTTQKEMTYPVTNNILQ